MPEQRSHARTGAVRRLTTSPSLLPDPPPPGRADRCPTSAQGFALGDGFLAGAQLLARAGVSLDLCIHNHQFAEVTELVRRHPDLTCVLDHLGKPQISPEGFRSWAADLRRLAALPNVTCKLSGLATQADPGHRTPSHLMPFLRQAIDSFGPGRCMFGSDWPVLTTAMSYRQWLDVVGEAIGDLTGEERLDVLGRTAEAVYGVDGPSRSDAPRSGAPC